MPNVVIVESKDIDVNKYIGKWFEVASFPFIFQRGCENTTAEYSFKEKGIKVFNSCDVKGKHKQSTGEAVTTDEKNVFKVGFPPFTFIKADYIIEYLFQNKDTKEYEYAIVGSSGKRYLWFLARDYRVEPDFYEYLVQLAKEKGYDVARLNRTKQCNAACGL